MDWPWEVSSFGLSFFAKTTDGNFLIAELALYPWGQGAAGLQGISAETLPSCCWKESAKANVWILLTRPWSEKLPMIQSPARPAVFLLP